jgi:hypothetical protein
MVGYTRDERFVIFRYTEGVGWMICRKESVEKAVESAFAYEPDVTNFHGETWSLGPSHGPGHPEGMSVRGVLDRELRAEDVIVGHGRWWQDEGKMAGASMGEMSTIRCPRTQLAIPGSHVTSRTTSDADA